MCKSNQFKNLFIYPGFVDLKKYAGKIVECTFNNTECLFKNRGNKIWINAALFYNFIYEKISVFFSSLQPDDSDEIVGTDCSKCLPNCSEEVIGGVILNFTKF